MLFPTPLRGALTGVLGLALAVAQAAPGAQLARLDTDKAAYQPGAPVQLTAALRPAARPGTTLVVSYYHLGQLLSRQTVAAQGSTVSCSVEARRSSFMRVSRNSWFTVWT